MIYLTGYVDDYTDALARREGLDLLMGVIIQPATKRYIERAGPYNWTAFDNGCFSPEGRRRFTMEGYMDLIGEAGDVASTATTPTMSVTTGSRGC